MHATNLNPNLIQTVTHAEQAARATRNDRLALAFQVISAVNLIVLTGLAATHLYRDLRRAETEKSRGR